MDRKKSDVRHWVFSSQMSAKPRSADGTARVSVDAQVIADINKGPPENWRPFVFWLSWDLLQRFV
jgi:hypothetical protein